MVMTERRREEDPLAPYYMRFVDDAERRFGIDLRGFYGEHTDLCDRIFEALDGIEPYQDLVDACLDARNAGDHETVRELNEAAGHPWGIGAIGALVWEDRLNPLLQEAYDHMEEAGLSPRKLFA